MSYTALFEHTVAGIAEHAVPLVKEWIRCGHRALIMAPDAELPGVRSVYNNLTCPELIEFKSFDRDPIEWTGLHALFNIALGEPGPAFCHPNTRFDIPRVTLNHGLTDKLTTFPAAFLGHGIGYNNVLLACGPAMFKGSWETYIKKWPETLSSLKIIPIGSPKTDVLFD